MILIQYQTNHVISKHLTLKTNFTTFEYFANGGRFFTSSSLKCLIRLEGHEINTK